MSAIESAPENATNLSKDDDGKELSLLQENGKTEWSKRRKRISYGTRKGDENGKKDDRIISAEELESFTQISKQDKGIIWNATLSQQECFDNEYDGRKDSKCDAKDDSETESSDKENVSLCSLMRIGENEGKNVDNLQSKELDEKVEEIENRKNFHTQTKDLTPSDQLVDSTDLMQNEASEGDSVRHENSIPTHDDSSDAPSQEDNNIEKDCDKTESEEALEKEGTNVVFDEMSKSVEKNLEKHDGQSDSEEKGQFSGTTDDSSSMIFSQEENRNEEGSERRQEKLSLEEGTSLPDDEPEQPSHEEIIKKTDAIYIEAEKETLTIKHIVKALEKMFQLRLKKAARKVIKARVLDLLLEKVQPGSEVISDVEAPKVKKVKKAKKEKKVVLPRTSPRKVSKKKKKRISAAERIHAEYQQRRLAEIERVRKEELLQEQERKLNEEDEERARLIAKKFETDSDELRIQRRQERLDLLTKLEETRKELLLQNDDEDDDDDEEGMNTVLSSLVKESNEKVHQDSGPCLSRGICDAKEEILLVDEIDETINQGENSVEDDESSDEDGDELEIVGLPSKLQPSDKFLMSPKQSENSSPRSVMDLFNDKVQGSKGHSNQTQKTVNSRALLKNFLRTQQISAGNKWLARELGYKNEEDHIRDCRQIEQRKRQQILEKEEERHRLFQLQKERMLAELDEKNEIEDENSEQNLDILRSRVDVESDEDKDEEENEELAMAREIEEEKALVLSTENQNENEIAFVNPSNLIEKDDGANLERASDQRKQEIKPLDKDGVMDDLIEKKDFSLSENTMMNPSLEENSLEESNTEKNDENKIPGIKESIVDDNTDTSEIHRTKENLSENEGEIEFDDALVENQITVSDKSVSKDIKKKEKNSTWKAMLRKEAEVLKKQKGNKNRMVDNEAEEEEEDAVAGLEDFGFTMQKKKTEEDEDVHDIEDDDLENIVDELSDDEGDEVAGEKARQLLAAEEEKEKHKEIMRRMREGYDGRKGGIGAGGSGARGNHRFDQLIAADNRDDAKRLGLLNDDEIDSDDGNGEENSDGEIEDENALLDKMLKDRYMNRIGLPEENFSEDEEDEVVPDAAANSEDEEEREQERLARRFAKRARMNRLLETHDESEFAQSRLLDDNENIRKELKYIKDVSRKRQVSISSTVSGSTRDASHSSADVLTKKAQKPDSEDSKGRIVTTGSSLSIALLANRKSGRKTNLFRANSLTRTNSLSRTKSVSLGRPVLFQAGDSNQNNHVKRTESLPLNGTKKIHTLKRSSSLYHSNSSKHMKALNSSSSLWKKVSMNGFRK